MDAERLLSRQTVLVRDGRISAIGPVDAVPLAQGTVQIEAQGRYLMPGLADMHVHFYDRAHGLLYVANGVTTVRNMWGLPAHLMATEQVERGEWVGPTFYTTGPITDGSPPVWPDSAIATSAEDGERRVEAQRADGFTSVKVYDNLSSVAYTGIVSAARRLGMPVVGHVPRAVGLQQALAARQDSIEHLTGYLAEAAFAGAAALADQTMAAGTWNCPTFTVLHHRASVQTLDARLARPEVRYLSGPLMRDWVARSAALALPAASLPQFATLVRALRDAGAPLLLGTDALNPWVVPGFSIHEELGHFLSASLTPFEALRAGTRDAARFLGQEHEFGTIEVGKRADMLLVDSNPLSDVGSIARRVGVMARGRWLTANDLQMRLEALAASLASPTPTPSD
jgi:imidazolonepropionase-like amidohydrolase